MSPQRDLNRREFVILVKLLELESSTFIARPVWWVHQHYNMNNAVAATDDEMSCKDKKSKIPQKKLPKLPSRTNVVKEEKKEEKKGKDAISTFSQAATMLNTLYTIHRIQCIVGTT